MSDVSLFSVLLCVLFPLSLSPGGGPGSVTSSEYSYRPRKPVFFTLSLASFLFSPMAVLGKL